MVLDHAEQLFAVRRLWRELGNLRAQGYIIVSRYWSQDISSSLVRFELATFNIFQFIRHHFIFRSRFQIWNVADRLLLVTGLRILLNLVLLVPPPLVDLTLGEASDFGNLVAGVFAPVRISLELAHEELDLVAVLPISLPFIGLVLSCGWVHIRLLHISWGHHLNFWSLGLEKILDVLERTVLGHHVRHGLIIYVEVWLKDIYLRLSITRIAYVQLVGAQIVILDICLPFVFVSSGVVKLAFVFVKLRIQSRILVTRVQLVSRLLCWK